MIDIGEKFKDNKGKIALKTLTKFFLPKNKGIQKESNNFGPKSGHNPEIDARATLKIYLKWIKIPSKIQEKIEKDTAIIRSRVECCSNINDVMTEDSH